MRRTLFTTSGLFFLCFSWMLFNAFAPSLSEEFGKANYYSDSLHGRKTSSGEKYDKNELSGAHKTLPFGTKVRVTRLDNKKSVILRINDRGPFKEGFIIELSRRAAEVVDLDRDGSASVRVEVVPDTDTNTRTAGSASASATSTRSAGAASASSGKADAVRPAQYSTTTTAGGRGSGSGSGSGKAPTTNATKVNADAKNTELYKVDLEKTVKAGFGLQLSTLYDADNVLPIVTKLQQQWPDKVLVNVERDPANDLAAYRVIIGPFVDEKTAAAQQKLAARRGYKKSFVVDLSEI